MNQLPGQAPSATIRPATPADVPGALFVRQQQEAVENATPTTTAEALVAEWATLGAQLAERVWVAVAEDGRLLAWVQLIHEDGVFIPRLWALSDLRERGLEAALLARVERQACAIGRAEGAADLAFFAQATSAHPAAQHALTLAGFAVSSMYETMELALDQPPALPDAIAGVEIRPFVVGRDEERVYRADEEAFRDQRGHTPRTFERWGERLNLHAEGYDPSLWRIAWAADEVAGVALGEVNEAVGWIHHLSVRRPWRRRGLGAALMWSALGAFSRRGVGVVRLNVDAESLTNAHLLYRRLGFRVIGAYTNYQRSLPIEECAARMGEETHATEV